MPAASLDVDDTLVDTNCHHALAWWRAFRRHDIESVDELRKKFDEPPLSLR